MDHPLTENISPGPSRPDIGAYEKGGGYRALKKVLKGSDPQGLIKSVIDSHLRGRGGAGFPTGRKWSYVPRGQQAVHPVYLIVNGDEMEPGTFKDRLLLENNPHLLIEGIIIGAYAIGADIAYIFLRREYTTAEHRCSHALSQAYEKGYLGRDILGSGFSLELYLHSSAGRYICGEETALLNGLEGGRAIPRAKPPFPPVTGLWAKPTIVNNVETICNVPFIAQYGADPYRELSRSVDGGTKLYGVSGRVKKPGLWELPMGTSMREILEVHAGGMQEGFTLRAIMPGGGSTEFVEPDRLDVKMDFDSLKAAGSRLGTATMIVLDDKTCPVGMVLNLMRFFALQSCGWCTPCREGLPWLARTLQAIEEGEGQMQDMEILRRHTRLLAPGHTFCALAPGAVEPLQSALTIFEDDFLRHIRKKRCPWK
jgi:NADH-quinone oxidoreductase subunit F